MIISKPEVLRLNGSRYFSGATNQQIRYPNIGFNGSAHPISFSVWVKPEGTITGNPYVYTSYNHDQDNWDWGTRMYSWSSLDRAMLSFRSNNQYKVTSEQVQWNTWQHWCATDEGDHYSLGDNVNWQQYVNGSLSGRISGSTGSSPVQWSGDCDLILGNRPQPEGSDGAEYEGYMAHFGFWNRVLFPSEVAWLAKGHSPLWFPNGLIFYAPLYDTGAVNLIGEAPRAEVGLAWQLGQEVPPVDIIHPEWVWTPQRFFNFPVSGIDLVVDDLSQSNTVEVALLPLYFEDGWESGDTSKWDSVNGSPRVNGSAAIDGSYGLEVNYDDGSHYAVKEHKNNGLEQRFTVEFDIDENDADAGDGASITHILLDDGGVYCGMVRITHDSGENYMQMRFRNDSGTWLSGTWYAPASWPVFVEADFDFANGDFKMWIDGTLRANNTGYDTDTRYPDAFRAGNGLSGGYVSGSIYTDNHKLYSGPRVGPTNITVDNLSQSNTVDKLTIDKVIALENLSQSNLVEKVSVEPGGSAVGYALAQANIVSVPTLTQVHNITVNNLSQSNLVESPWVNTAYQLETINLSLSGIVSKPSLTQVHNISVTNISQQGYVQTAYLGEWWTEVHEEVGPVTIEYSVVGLIEQLWEDYGIIDMEHDLDTYIDQALEENGEIGQTLDLEAPIAITHEQDGEI